jgi:hypothetical protein
MAPTSGPRVVTVCQDRPRSRESSTTCAPNSYSRRDGHDRSALNRYNVFAAVEASGGARVAVAATGDHRDAGRNRVDRRGAVFCDAVCSNVHERRTRRDGTGRGFSSRCYRRDHRDSHRSERHRRDADAGCDRARKAGPERGCLHRAHQPSTLCSGRSSRSGALASDRGNSGGSARGFIIANRACGERRRARLAQGPAFLTSVYEPASKLVHSPVRIKLKKEIGGRAGSDGMVQMCHRSHGLGWPLSAQVQSAATSEACSHVQGHPSH